jgi:branched-subunit amino acid aminotransferase/4-amino-4-deoxychorismate lyase
MANIFWLEYNKTELFTPGLETGCLAGTMREFILEKLRVIEIKKDINELLRDAEYIFLTSSGNNVIQVSDVINEIKFTDKLHKLIRIIEK